MLEEIRGNIKKLISLYEDVKAENEKLREDLQNSREREESQRKQIDELEKKVDNLKLVGAFSSESGNSDAAKQKIDKLIRDIDKCISLLE